MSQVNAKSQAKRRRRVRRSPRRPEPGAAPGDLNPTSTAGPLDKRAMVFNEAALTLDGDVTLATLPVPLGDCTTWLDVVGAGTPETLRGIGERYGLHPLALEDVAHVHQRPKVEPYGDHLFIVLRLPRPGDTLAVEQISMFLGRGWVITFQEKSGDCFEPVRQRIRLGKGRVRQAGADYLAYCLLDAAVDHYFPLLEQYEDTLTSIEDEILSSSPQDAIARLVGLKRDLGVLRRAVGPLRDALGSLIHGAGGPFTTDTVPYLRDCRDHADQVLDLVDGLRDQAASLVDLQLSMVSYRMNDVMKVLTIIATIFMPLGFIAGVYGMNFDGAVSPWNMPELRWAYGYPAAVGLMAVTAGGLTWFFHKKGWLR